MKYYVNFQPSGAYTVTVDIPEDEIPEDPYELEDKLMDIAYDAVPRGVCAQCSGWGQDWGLDFGDAEVSSIYDENNEAIYEQ